MYRIGVIADTHGLLRENVKDILHTCDVILHGGDINTPNVIEQLKAIAPLYAVRGNVDKEWANDLPKTLSLELFGLKIFMIHNKKLIQQDIHDIHDQDIIIYAHSHKYETLQKGSQTWLNPGSCGARRFSLPVTMAVITISENASCQIERIDLAAPSNTAASENYSKKDMKDIVLCVMKDTDKGKPVAAIAKKQHISEDLASRICRLYLTHPGVSVDGILQKMGL